MELTSWKYRFARKYLHNIQVLHQDLALPWCIWLWNNHSGNTAQKGNTDILGNTALRKNLTMSRILHSMGTASEVLLRAMPTPIWWTGEVKHITDERQGASGAVYFHLLTDFPFQCAHMGSESRALLSILAPVNAP